MLLQENFAEEHIRELQRTSRRDPVLLERAVYAFGLLEALAKVGMEDIWQTVADRAKSEVQKQKKKEDKER